MTTEINPAEVKMAKYKCLDSLLFSTRYFFKHKHKRKFVVNHHHVTICNALERVLRGELTRLIINIAPRYGKTELAVKNLIAHGLALNASAKFIHLSYSDTLALDNSEDVKDIINDESYQQLFPEVQIKKGSDSKQKWYTTEGGGVYATSAAGQVTGFGAGKVDEEEEDPDLVEFLDGIGSNEGEENAVLKKKKFNGAIIIDDPIKPDDADSENIRERVNNRFDSTIRNRTNSRNTPIIIIMQRLHENDLSGYLQREEEADDWEVISLPALYHNEAGELEALWPFKHTVKELQALQAANELVFDRQYGQNAGSKKGKLFPGNELQYYNPLTVDVESLVEFKMGVIDPADEGGDDLSFPTGYLIGDKIYVTDVIYNKEGTDINESACVDKILTLRHNNVVIESNSAWLLFAKAVRVKVQEVYEDCEIRAVKNTTNKHSRIWAQSGFIKNHFVFRSDYKNLPQYYAFMKNFLDYNKSQEGAMKNKHEDSADSAAEMAKWFRANFGHLWPIVVATKSES